MKSCLIRQSIWIAMAVTLLLFGCSKPTDPNQCSTPTLSPPGGTYDAAQTVVLSCATNGSVIRYTIDGSDPSQVSSFYSKPISINQNTTIKAKAYKDGLTPSEMAIASYTIVISPGEMIYVQGGSITIGDTNGGGWFDETPTHNVTLNSFYIGKYEVTQSEYSAIMGFNPAYDHGVGNNYPAHNISWYAAIKYCNLLSIAQGYTPAYTINGSTNPIEWGPVPTSNNVIWNNASCNWNANGYRLPTEAEWEFAARGGLNNPNYLYSGSDNVGAVAWYYENSTNSAHPVGHKSHNGIGIYDMSGNVYEWCWDYYSEEYYSNSLTNNPTGPFSGNSRVHRGGAWSTGFDHCRVARRGNLGMFSENSNQGLRICRKAT